jgi:hypothetical protein
MHHRTTADYVSQFHKLKKIYDGALERFTNAHDINEMRSAAVEMEAVASELDALSRERIARYASTV